MPDLAFILLVFVAARALGRVAQLLHQPASIGEVLAGALIALGLAFWPEGANLAALAHDDRIGMIAQAAIFLLLLRAGVEMEPAEIVQNSGVSFRVALGGSLVPLGLGCLLGWLILPDGPLKLAQTLLVGTGLAISAVPVAAKVLLEFGLLHKRVGEVIMAAAVFDDVLALILLAAITGIAAGVPLSAGGIVGLLTEVAAFFLITGVAGRVLIPHLWPHLIRHGAAMPLSALLVLALAFGLLAEALGLHFILGPFVAGLFCEQAHVGKHNFRQIKHVLDMVAFGLLGPIFFASIGLRLDISAILEVPLFLFALLVIAFAGKILGAGLAAYSSGVTTRESVAIGVGMSGRGAIELIVADLALRYGLLGPPAGGDVIVENLFSALVITAIVTTMATPWLLRAVLRL